MQSNDLSPIQADGSYHLLGLPRLMQHSFAGGDLKPLAATLLDYAARYPQEAAVLMDIATILFLSGNRELGLALQRDAMTSQSVFHVPPAGGAPATLRVLALLAPGDLMANTPLEFLLEGSSIALDLMYLDAAAIPPTVPEHDVLFVAVGESDENAALLSILDAMLADWPRPVLNRPGAIAQLSRDRVPSLLAGVAGLFAPPCRRLARSTVAAFGSGAIDLHDLLPDAQWPVIVRPVGSHAGQGLKKIAGFDDIPDYLHGVPSDEFYLAPFIDYRSADGLFRKYRIMFIAGQAFVAHMGISSFWMVHYLNAGMTDDAAKRDEEARCMASFDATFVSRHQYAFAALTERVGLDYVGIDCAETRDGQLLIFEVDSDMIVHAMDPTDLFAYKTVPMNRLFAAFQQLLHHTVGDALPVVRPN